MTTLEIFNTLKNDAAFILARKTGDYISMSRVLRAYGFNHTINDAYDMIEGFRNN